MRVWAKTHLRLSAALESRKRQERSWSPTGFRGRGVLPTPWFCFFVVVVFWLCWVFIAACRFSLIVATEGYSLLRCAGFSLQWLLLLRSTGSRRWASVVVAHGLSSCGLQALERRLSSCGTWAWLLHGMWDLPGPGIEPMSPALAGGFLTTGPPGKSQHLDFRLLVPRTVEQDIFVVLSHPFTALCFGSPGELTHLLTLICDCLARVGWVGPVALHEAPPFWSLGPSLGPTMEDKLIPSWLLPRFIALGILTWCTLH